jgi:hypothetical protein
MKSAHEIAWTLLSDFYRPWEKNPNSTTVLSFDHVQNITGLDVETLTKMNEKRSLVKEIQRIKDGVTVAKQVIEEMEAGKPHYEVGVNDE